MAVPSYWPATSSKTSKLPTTQVEEERSSNQRMTITNIFINQIKRCLSVLRLPLVRNPSNSPSCRAVSKLRRSSKPMGDPSRSWVTRETIHATISPPLRKQANLVPSPPPIFSNDQRFKMWRSLDTIKCLTIKNKWCNNSMDNKSIVRHRNRSSKTWKLKSRERRAWASTDKFSGIRLKSTIIRIRSRVAMVIRSRVFPSLGRNRWWVNLRPDIMSPFLLYLMKIPTTALSNSNPFEKFRRLSHSKMQRT